MTILSESYLLLILELGERSPERWNRRPGPLEPLLHAKSGVYSFYAFDEQSPNRLHNNRWKRWADPSLNMEPFTPEEDKTILDLQEKYGSKWQVIANEVGTGCVLESVHCLARHGVPNLALLFRRKGFHIQTRYMQLTSTSYKRDARRRPGFQMSADGRVFNLLGQSDSSPPSRRGGIVSVSQSASKRKNTQLEVRRNPQYLICEDCGAGDETGCDFILCDHCNSAFHLDCVPITYEEAVKVCNALEPIHLS
jgi:hypothetical protein